MMREDFLRDLAKLKFFWQRRSPGNVPILAAIENDLNLGNPSWFERLGEIWKGREFVNDFEPPALLVNQLHYRKLFYEEDSLRDPVEYLRSAPASFWEELKTIHLQTNDTDRSIGWILAACAGFLSRGTPFHLIDLGTSAGLTLIGDYLPRNWAFIREDGHPAPEPLHWQDSPFPVLSRTGLDAYPRSLAKREDRLWLEACLGPDNAESHARFEKAAELFLRLQKDPNGPKLFQCQYDTMPSFIESRFKPHPDEGLLIYNSQASIFLTDADYGELKQGLARVLASWEDRGFWAELELPRDKSAEIHELRVHRVINGQLEAKALASMTAKPKEIKILSGWDFLRPLRPVRPQKNTREEPIKQLKPGVYKF